MAMPRRQGPDVAVGPGRRKRLRVCAVNERGQEFFAPGQSGTIITARDARRGPAQAGRSITFGDTIINAAPGMDPQAIARAVRREMQAMMDTSRALHDGGLHE